MAMASTSFKGGLQTGLIFGADASTCKELTNFYVNADGSVAKRPGLEELGDEQDYSISIPVSDITPGSPSPSGVIKVTSSFYFWDTESVTKLVEHGYARVVSSPTYHAYYYYVRVFSLDGTGAASDPSLHALDDLDIIDPTTETFDTPLSVSVTSNSKEVFFGVPSNRTFGGYDYRRYDGEITKAVTLVRDYWAPQVPDSRSTSFNQYLVYFWYNAGWTIQQLSKMLNGAGLGGFPSKYDIPYYLKNNKGLSKVDGIAGGGILNDVAGLMGGAGVSMLTDAALGGIYDAVVNMDLELPTIHSFGTLAPVGSNLIGAYVRDRTSPAFTQYVTDFNTEFGTALDPLDITIDSDNLGSKSAVEVHGGRLFRTSNATPSVAYETSPVTNNFIYYSQPLTGLDDHLRCHSTQSPTNEDFTPTASDGGFFTLPSKGEILDMVSDNNILYVFTSEEVVAVVSQSAQFNPTSYSVMDVLPVGISQPSNITKIGTGLALLGTDSRVYGIQGGEAVDLNSDSIRQELISYSLSDEAILSYDSASSAIKVHLPTRIQQVGSLQARNYTDTLIFSTTNKSWSKYVFADTESSSGLVYGIPNNFTSTITPYIEDRTSSAVRLQERDRYISSTLHLILNNTTLNSARLSEKSLMDFGTEDYTAVLETNELVQAPQGKRNNTTYLTSYFLRTEGEDAGVNLVHESACTVTGIYDYEYTNASVQGAYYYSKTSLDTTARTQNVVHSKLTLPGNADNIRIRYESEAGKDCVLLGYNLDINVNVRK